MGPATEDALFGGQLILAQLPRGEGYRTNVDAVLLAAFAAEPAGPTGERRLRRAARVACDLGAGVGAVGLSLLRLRAAERVLFVEIDPRASAMTEHNLRRNGWAARGEVVVGDVAEVALRRRGEAQLVVCNPPYYLPGRARAPRSEDRARIGDLGIFVRAARQIAGRAARVCFVYPAAELTLLLSTLSAQGLHAKRLRLVHARSSAPARVALVEARAGRAGGLRVAPPFVERTSEGYTAELARLLAG
jgi:tRNA1Val (adenine37-N6)-methyltransferase